MREPLGDDDIARLQGGARSPAAHRRAADVLVAASEQPHPSDAASPAGLLCAAAWHRERAGDVAEAIALYRRAVDADGRPAPDPRALLVGALLGAGHPEQAREVAEELRRAGPRSLDALVLAEVFELAGDLRQAHRWAALGITRLDRDDDPGQRGDPGERHDEDELAAGYLFDARDRIRAALGSSPAG